MAGDLLKALAAATVEDLEAVEKEIILKKTELEALNHVARILRTRLGRREPTHQSNGENKGPSKPKGGRPPSDELVGWRRACLAFIREEGPTHAAVLKNRLSIPDSRIYTVLDYPLWFSKGPNGYSATPAALREIPA